MFGEVGAHSLVRLSAVVSDLPGLSLCQRRFKPVHIQVPTVGWRAGMLAPRVGERPGVNAVEAKCVDQAQHQFFGMRIVPSDGEANAPRSAGWGAARGQAGNDDVVERLDYGDAEHPCHPLAVGQTAIDLSDETVAARILIPCINNDSQRCG